MPYHRLLPYRLPPRADAAAGAGPDLAARLAGRLRPAVLHAASNHLNGQLALALREDFGLPVIYEARGFWEETWLSRHGGDPGDPAAQDAGRPAPSQPVNEKDLQRAAGSAGAAGTGAGSGAVRDGVVPVPLPGPTWPAATSTCSAGRPRPAAWPRPTSSSRWARSCGRRSWPGAIDPAKVLVVPNAVSDEFLGPLPDAAAAAGQLGMRPGEQVAGVVSNLVGYEGIDTLLAAAAELRSRGAAGPAADRR